MRSSDEMAHEKWMGPSFQPERNLGHLEPLQARIGARLGDQPKYQAA
jgi:hypothetical protein